MTQQTSWDDILEELRGELPLEFLQRWIAKESGGNACATGSYGGPWEVGIGQLYFDRDQETARQYGATLSELRSYCDGTSQRQSRKMSDDERRLNVSATLIGPANAYLSIARQRLTSIGAAWTEEDTLCLAKLYHALPVLVTAHLSVANEDGNAYSWDAYRGYVGNMTRDEVLEFDRRAGYTPPGGAAAYWPLDRLFANAQYTGRGD